MRKEKTRKYEKKGKKENENGSNGIKGEEYSKLVSEILFQKYKLKSVGIKSTIVFKVLPAAADIMCLDD